MEASQIIAKMHEKSQEIVAAIDQLIEYTQQHNIN